MSQTQQAEDSQHSFMLPIRTKKAPKKRSHGERDKKLLEAEIDLVENVLTIPDVPEVVMETWKNDSIDKTMARSAYDITINERFQSLTDEGFCSVK